MMNSKILALHIAYARYCTYHMTTKLLMKELLENFTKSPKFQKKIDDFKMEEDNQTLITYTSRSYLSLDYSLLYEVINGYMESKLKDPILDELLREEDELTKLRLDKLRLLRNSVFHPKKFNKYIEILLNFLEIPDSEKWIKELDRAFSKLFMSDPFVGKKAKHCLSIV